MPTDTDTIDRTTDIDLTDFCSEYRHPFMEPFSVGDRTYATDGRVLVRVPRRDDVPELPDATRFSATVIAMFVAEMGQRTSFDPMPLAKAIVPGENPSDCALCDGSGIDSYGEIIGVESGGTCPACLGECSVGTNLPNRTVFETHDFDPDYILLMRNLPGLTVSFGPEPAVSGVNPKDMRQALIFRFDGGDGCLMPMNRPAESTAIRQAEEAA